MATDPMSQFEVTDIIAGPQIGPFDLTFTNSALWMAISSAVVIVFFLLTARGKLIPDRLQSIGELSYEFIANMLKDTTGPEAMKFFPFIFTLFFFILAINLLGMNAYWFTPTSHLAITAAMAIMTIGIVVIAGIWKNGFKWFKIFLPGGIPIIMAPVIIIIEIISFLSRPLTLAVRLFANMTAGHVMLKLFAIFIAYLVGKGGLFAGLAIVPILGTMGVVALEFLVAFLQAFVFAMLTCIYLNDVYHVDH